MRKIEIPPTFIFHCPVCAKATTIDLTLNIPINQTWRIQCKCGKPFNILLRKNKKYPFILEVTEIP